MQHGGVGTRPSPLGEPYRHLYEAVTLIGSLVLLTVCTVFGFVLRGCVT